MQSFIDKLFLIMIRNMLGKYAKIALERLENLKEYNYRDLRKIILDMQNDCYREVEKRANTDFSR